MAFNQPKARSDAWPTFNDGRKVIACWTDAEKENRVFVLLRSDGMFNHYAEMFSDSDDEMCWVQSDRGLLLFDTEDEAFEAIEQAHSWTSEVERETPQDQ